MEFFCKYNTATTFYFPMVKRGVVDLAVTGDWTPANGDCNISKDGGAQANPAGTIAISTGITWKLALTGTELSAAEIDVMIVDSATKAVEDQWFKIYTYGHASAKIQADLSDVVRLGLTALPNAAANAAGGLPISSAGGLDMDDIGADVDAIETRVTTALPNAAPQAAGGLITSIAGSLDLDEMNTDIEAIQASLGAEDNPAWPSN